MGIAEGGDPVAPVGGDDVLLTRVVSADRGVGGVIEVDAIPLVAHRRDAVGGHADEVILDRVAIGLLRQENPVALVARDDVAEPLAGHADRVASGAPDLDAGGTVTESLLAVR